MTHAAALVTDRNERAERSQPTVARAGHRRMAEASPVDDTPSAATILNRGDRPLELTLLMTGLTSGGVITVRNRDRQPQLVRVLMLRRRIAAAADCARVASVTLEPQHDGTIIAVEVPAFSSVDLRFRVARADECVELDDARGIAAAVIVKAARGA